MTHGVAASAPGKVVLCGEYAVLAGAPAVCMAVDRRAIVTAVGADGDDHALTTCGYRDGCWRFRARAGALTWLAPAPPPGSLRLFEEVWRHVAPALPQPMSICIDTASFAAGAHGEKLGLGSSAALAVALGAVLARIAGDDTRLRCAADAHRAYQGGRGSGADIATSRHGGLIEYRADTAQRPAALRWPRDLHCAFLWSGVPANTADKLRALGDVQGGTAGRSLRALAGQAAAVAARWRRGDAAGVLATLADYAQALRAFDVDRALGIFDAGHARLAELAAAGGLVYKPCGAGGGDIGAVFGGSAAQIARYVEQARARGYPAVDVSIDNDGLTYLNAAGP